MLATHFILLVIGAIAIALGLRLKEEVYRLAIVAAGSIALIWGYSWSPSTIQLLLAVVALSYYRFSRQPSKC